MSDCAACGGARTDSRGRPCWPCVRAGRVPPAPHTNSGVRLVRAETEAERLVREFMGLARQVAAMEAPEEDPAEAEARETAEKVERLRRLRREAEAMEGQAPGGTRADGAR